MQNVEFYGFFPWKSGHLSSHLWSTMWFFLQASRCAYTIVIMAVYWMTEVLPMAVTALLPIVLFPWLGVVGSKTICTNYLKVCNYACFKVYRKFQCTMCRLSWEVSVFLVELIIINVWYFCAISWFCKFSAVQRILSPTDACAAVRHRIFSCIIAVQNALQTCFLDESAVKQVIYTGILPEKISCCVL